LSNRQGGYAECGEDEDEDEAILSFVGAKRLEKLVRERKKRNTCFNLLFVH